MASKNKLPITRPFIEQTDPSRSPKETLPTMYDLPSEDPEEPGLPDEFHLWQADLLSFTFRPVNYSADQVFVASDLNLYYDSRHPNWYKRPDWFAVVGVDLTESKVWIPTLQMGLGLWQGEYRGVIRPWLRWYDASENWILTEEEREREEKQAAQRQTQAAQQQAQEAQQRVEVLAEYLRKMGVNPDEIES